jgi:hypothetical protein
MLTVQKTVIIKFCFKGVGIHRMQQKIPVAELADVG